MVIKPQGTTTKQIYGLLKNSRITKHHSELQHKISDNTKLKAHVIMAFELRLTQVLL